MGAELSDPSADCGLRPGGEDKRTAGANDRGTSDKAEQDDARLFV